MPALSAVGGQTDIPFIYRLLPRARPLAAYTALEASEGGRSVGWTLSARPKVDLLAGLAPQDADYTKLSEAHRAAVAEHPSVRH